jgi:hypothetical protein
MSLNEAPEPNKKPTCKTAHRRRAPLTDVLDWMILLVLNGHQKNSAIFDFERPDPIRHQTKVQTVLYSVSLLAAVRLLGAFEGQAVP